MSLTKVTYSMIKDAPVNVADFGAVGDGVTDDSVAIQACFDYCRDNDMPWRMNGTYAADNLICYNSGDANGSTIIATNNGQITPVFSVSAKASDINSNDTALLTAFNALLPLSKNTSVIPSLAAWKGKSLRLASSSRYITRIGSATDWRTELVFDVLDSEGTIYPPIPFDVSAITFTTGVSTIITKPTVINDLNININSGSTGRNTKALFEVSKPNTIINALSVKNNTITPIAAGSGFLYTTNITFNNLRVDGMLEASTNYGLSGAGSNITVNNANLFGCRRGFDSTYGNGISINGGVFPDGIGAHLAFNATIIGAYISSDPPNNSPVFWSGGDVTLSACKIVANGTNACSFRQDTPELIGKFQLVDSDIYFNQDSATGSATLAVFNHDYPVTSFDPGRNIAAPDTVNICNNSIYMSGAGHTNKIALYQIEDNINNLNAARSFVTGTNVIAEGNTFKFENNLPAVTQVINKRASFTGTGFRITLKDIPEFNGFFGDTTGTATTTARSHLIVESYGAVDINVDGGCLESYFVNGTNFSSSTAVGSTSLLYDEQFWYSINNFVYKRLITIEDDSAFKFPSPFYTEYHVYEANGGSTAIWCDVIADVDGGGEGLTLKAKDAATTWTMYNIQLTGTTGADGGMNLSAYDGDFYVENRTGGTISFLIAKN